MKKFEKVNQSNIFLYHVIEKMIFYKFIIFWRIPKSSKMNSDFPPTANAQPSKKAYSLYLWPRSKCWIRASRASIQHAATKVTNIGNKLSSKASILPAANQNFSIFSLCRNSMEVTVPTLPAMPLDLPYKHPQSWFFPLLRLLLPFWLQVQRFHQS